MTGIDTGSPAGADGHDSALGWQLHSITESTLWNCDFCVDMNHGGTHPAPLVTAGDQQVLVCSTWKASGDSALANTAVLS